ncbi:MAG: hypothetical protein QOH93_2267 [Chloroflexia bacterium]|nr:hypothetical protein [Chloroflexia bacterium]
MAHHLTCILREEENRWIGRVYESKFEGGGFQYSYGILAPLRFEGGHAFTAISAIATDKTYHDRAEVETAMRHELHERSESETSQG